MQPTDYSLDIALQTDNTSAALDLAGSENISPPPIRNLNDCTYQPSDYSPASTAEPQLPLSPDFAQELDRDFNGPSDPSSSIVEFDQRLTELPIPSNQSLVEQSSFPLSITEASLPFNPGFAQGLNQDFYGLSYLGSNNISDLDRPLTEPDLPFIQAYAEAFTWAPSAECSASLGDLNLLHQLFEEPHLPGPKQDHQNQDTSCNDDLRATSLGAAPGNTGHESHQLKFAVNFERDKYAGPPPGIDLSCSPDLEEYKRHIRATRYMQSKKSEHLSMNQFFGDSPLQSTPRSGITAC